jgi:hypothetical protein
MTKITVSEFGTVADVDADAPLTDKQIVDAMAAVEEKRKKKIKDYKSGTDRTEAFRDSHFICVKCNVAMPIQDKAEIDSHRNSCGYQLSIKKKKDFEKQQYIAGAQELRYQLHIIEEGKRDIEIAQEKIQDAQVRKHKLLNDRDVNKQRGTNEAYEEYLSMSDRACQRRYL